MQPQDIQRLQACALLLLISTLAVALYGLVTQAWLLALAFLVLASQAALALLLLRRARNVRR